MFNFDIFGLGLMLAAETFIVALIVTLIVGKIKLDQASLPVKQTEDLNEGLKFLLLIAGFSAVLGLVFSSVNIETYWKYSLAVVGFIVGALVLLFTILWWKQFRGHRHAAEISRSSRFQDVKTSLDSK